MLQNVTFSHIRWKLNSHCLEIYIFKKSHFFGKKNKKCSLQSCFTLDHKLTLTLLSFLWESVRDVKSAAREKRREFFESFVLFFQRVFAPRSAVWKNKHRIGIIHMFDNRKYFLRQKKMSYFHYLLLKRFQIWETESITH